MKVKNNLSKANVNDVNKCKSGGVNSTNSKMYLEIKKNNGKFYDVYDMDAYILNNLFGYKVYENHKKKMAGFPETAFDKVVNKLDELKISYKINFTTSSNVIIKDYKKLNQYLKYYEDTKKSISIQDKIDCLILGIKKLNNIDFVELVKIIENYIDEH
jgi:hypothetical protein